MTNTVYAIGGEDVDHFALGGAVVSTTSGKFRSTYARCSLKALGRTTITGENYWQNSIAFSASAFWFTAQTITDSASFGNANPLLEFIDVSGIVRLRVIGTGTAGSWKVQKLDSAASATQIGSNFSMPVSATTVDKLDINLDYSATGSLVLYLNGVLLFSSGTVDLTTDGISALAGYRLKCESTSGVGGNRYWSEMCVRNWDTRSLNIQTLQPVANGNTHDWDTGTPAAANVNEITLSDATLDGSTTNGQIDQYTVPAEASGTFTIEGIAVSARSQKGSSGPAHLQLNVRSGGSDYFSSSHSLDIAWAAYQDIWLTDPNTSATWAAYPANIGAKAVT